MNVSTSFNDLLLAINRYDIEVVREILLNNPEYLLRFGPFQTACMRSIFHVNAFHIFELVIQICKENNYNISMLIGTPSKWEYTALEQLMMQMEQERKYPRYKCPYFINVAKILIDILINGKSVMV